MSGGMIRKEQTKAATRMYRGAQWVYLQAPLTSTSWDGDSFSTTAKTLIDLSAVFGVPANVKAIYARVFVNDSASAQKGSSRIA